MKTQCHVRVDLKYMALLILLSITNIGVIYHGNGMSFKSVWDNTSSS